MKRELGSAIKERRLRLGLTQGALAKIAEVSIPQISNIERGEFLPSLDSLRRIAKALRTTIPHLFAFDLDPDARAALKAQAQLIALVQSLGPDDLQLASSVIKAIASVRSKAKRPARRRVP
jgi:transcriptional regulator with XRE-family HTH domain